jgi:hypothetical protein
VNQIPERLSGARCLSNGLTRVGHISESLARKKMMWALPGGAAMSTLELMGAGEFTNISGPTNDEIRAYVESQAK